MAAGGTVPPEEWTAEHLLFEEVLASGATSVVHASACGEYVRKSVTRSADKFGKRGCYKREVHVLGMLASLKAPWIPEVVGRCDASSTITMRNCGVPLTRENAPRDARVQMLGILASLKTHGIQHNDIAERQLLVREGVISLCDWGWASINGCLGCGIGINSEPSPVPDYPGDQVALDRVCDRVCGGLMEEYMDVAR